jgi:hypothetical protein
MWQFALFTCQRRPPMHMANIPIDGRQKSVAFRTDNVDNVPGHNMKIGDWLDV